LDVLDAPSAERILPEGQHLHVEDVIPIGEAGDSTMQKQLAFAGRLAAAGAGLAAASYAAYAGITWLRYGRVSAPAGGGSRDRLLDRFMPVYEVAERHHVRVDAPAQVTFAAATEMYLEQSPIVRWIFKVRGWAMGSQSASREEDVAPFLTRMRSIGWGVLAEVPGREIVMGAVTRPWMADVVFRPVPPDEFASFQEPDHVKIIWTLRADPTGPEESIFRTETRVVSTDLAARKKFRRYWAFASPGIILIRWASLRPLKSEAERRHVEHRAAGSTAFSVVR
jgi:hypothetical protein